MTNEQLQRLIESISMTYFQKPFQHEASFNHRLRTTGGRYLLYTHNIEINPKSFQLFGMEELIGIIKHELCHYHLHIEGRGYQHRDQDFRKLLLEVGAPRHCSTIETPRRTRRHVIEYQCKKCGLSYRRKKRMDTEKYRCGKCYGNIELKK